jgi:hypothetical protein
MSQIYRTKCPTCKMIVVVIEDDKGEVVDGFCEVCGYSWMDDPLEHQTPADSEDAAMMMDIVVVSFGG